MSPDVALADGGALDTGGGAVVTVGGGALGEPTCEGVPAFVDGNVDEGGGVPDALATGTLGGGEGGGGFTGGGGAAAIGLNAARAGPSFSSRPT